MSHGRYKAKKRAKGGVTPVWSSTAVTKGLMLLYMLHICSSEPGLLGQLDIVDAPSRDGQVLGGVARTWLQYRSEDDDDADDDDDDKHGYDLRMIMMMMMSVCASERTLAFKLLRTEDCWGGLFKYY
ncbi:hypothetical protein GOP47_0028723 [Adiantum capillus-veneris]|nr:hypothetical protein GOP47_0028723 [Adiantum capillus-veneris]